MRDDNGLLLASPLSGLGFQTAGALQRLGRRMTALVPNDDAKSKLREVPMPQYVYDWENLTLAEPTDPPRDHNSGALLLSPEPELARNEPLSEPRLLAHERLARKLLTQHPELELHIVLPQSSARETILRAQSWSPHGVVYLAPALYGFRDGNLMDEALALNVTHPGALRLAHDRSPTPLLSSGDAAAFIASALGRRDLFGQVTLLPAQTTSLTEWLQAFRRHFATPGPRLAERLGFRTRSLAKEIQIRTEATDFPGARLASEVFASPATSLDRSLREMAAHRKRDPGASLIFPPARGIG